MGNSHQPLESSYSHQPLESSYSHQPLESSYSHSPLEEASNQPITSPTKSRNKKVPDRKVGLGKPKTGFRKKIRPISGKDDDLDSGIETMIDHIKEEDDMDSEIDLMIDHMIDEEDVGILQS